jgi:methionyl-tRNA formyltransferase
MRFAITAVDRYLGVFEALVGAGWEPVKLFTTPLRTPHDSHQAVIAYAEKHRIGIQLSRMTEGDLRALHEQQCDILVVASYNWIIGDWRPYLKYAVNFHASPLPEGRGPYPVINAILDKYERWGVACHRVTPDVDHGEVLASEQFPLQPDECHESLDLKIQMAARRLAAKVAGDFEELWKNAKPQVGGSYKRRLTYADHALDFSQPVDSIMRKVRAFGLLESLAEVNGIWIGVRRACGWTEAHSHTPGHVVHVFNRNFVIAAADGYIAIIEWNFATPEVVLEIRKGGAPKAAGD